MRTYRTWTGRPLHRWRVRLALLVTVAGTVAGCSTEPSVSEVHLAVWQYQLASHAQSIGREPVCVGLRVAANGVLDPAPELMAVLNEPVVRVVPASACQPGSRGFVLGPVEHEGGDVRVEGSALDGTYRYRLRRLTGGFRVISGAMRTVY